MGTYTNYHETSEATNSDRTREYGEPAYSLFTAAQVFTLHKHIEIYDGQGQLAYEANTVFPSLHDKTDVVDSHGNQVAHIERELFTIRQRHYVTMANGESFQVSKELFHLIKDIIHIEELGWVIQGNILGLDFEMHDNAGNIIAVIGRKMLSLHNKYCIDIYKPEYEQTIVAILIALQHMMRDRAAASSHSSSASSPSGN